MACVNVATISAIEGKGNDQLTSGIDTLQLVMNAPGERWRVNGER